MKIVAEPTLVAESGRAASFRVGGTIAYPTPQGVGVSAGIQFQPYGTTIDFVPIVLGNGRIRLEVRPSISEPDAANGTTISGTTVPGFLDRTVDTAVELSAGQTMAIAGLLQTRLESWNRGLPWISEIPYLGAAFRKVHEEVNEVELLIMVTPEFVDGMDACEVPPCGPGMETTSPSDWELFLKGHLEVPKCCPAGNGEGGAPCNNGSPTPVPDDGMIGPEQISTPPASGPANGASRPDAKPAARTTNATRGGSSSSTYNRYTSSKSNKPSGDSSSGDSNAPPGFIGPVGYDVVK